MINGRFSVNSLSVMAVGLCMIFGCQSENSIPLGAVSGTVTRGDERLDEGQVSFMSRDGFGANAPIDSEGRYELTSQYGNRIPAGTYHVVVVPASHLEIPVGDTPPAIRNDKKQADTSKVPQKYWDFATSGLQYEIRSGKQTIDIRLDK